MTFTALPGTCWREFASQRAIDRRRGPEQVSAGKVSPEPI